MGNINTVCCFTGHRHIEASEFPIIGQRLKDTMRKLIKQGVVFYGCGGAIGFDMLAGFVTLELKKECPAVKLIMVLPCRNQDNKWLLRDKANYRKLLAAADKIVYVSEQYFEGCMAKRNAHLVQNSGTCIAYLKHTARSGTAQTVRMAREKGLTVFNLAEY